MKEQKGTYLFNDKKKKLEVPDAINYKLRRLYGISQIMQLKAKKIKIILFALVRITRDLM